MVLRGVKRPLVAAAGAPATEGALRVELLTAAADDVDGDRVEATASELVDVETGRVDADAEAAVPPLLAPGPAAALAETVALLEEAVGDAMVAETPPPAV